MKLVRKFSILLLLVTIFYGCSDSGKNKDQSERPNFLVIMVDDLGYSDLGCYGAEIIETPKIDEIAEEGLRFRNFTNTAKCHSSRVSLLSGLWCEQAGSSSLKNAVTFPELLQKSGYHTGMTGKWHLSKNPLDWGFDKYFGHLLGWSDFIGGNDTWRYGRDVYNEFGTSAEEFYATDAMTDYAIEFLNEWEKDDDSPFALYIAYNAPHSPLQAPEALVRKYRGKFMDGWETIQQKRYENQLKSGVIEEGTKLPPWPDHHRKWDEASELDRSWADYRRAIFAAMVESLDSNVGRLVDELKRTGEWENTVFIFLSDNGADSREIARNRNILPWKPKSHLLIGTEWAGVSNTPFRWYKQNQHNGGVVTPMIVSWPDGLKAYGWNNFRGHITDIYPTLLELAGVEYPENYNDKETLPLAGVSLMPVIEGEKFQRDKPIYLKFASHKGIIDGNMKLVSARNGPWELYDLDKDPTELNDLSPERPDLVAELKAKWLEIAKTDGNSAKYFDVNDFIAPWGTRSYSNESVNAYAGDPSPVELPPDWKDEPPLGL